uniref:DNA primase n=1 Tax=candidate division WOR-3 bacterium TaxID=2052148 RepID=A0A7C4XEQ3_UNCW3
MVERDKIDEIIRRTDIVDLISQYVQLKKVGKNYRALCPFHSERAPSFYVSPDKGIYYCFGCKKGGNAISFLMEYEHLDFPDALKKLARNLGIDIDTTKDLKYKELYEVNEFAAQFYSLALSKEIGRRGQNYLKERKIDLEKIKDFRLGYAPTSGGLVTFLRQKGINIERLNQAGLISQNRELFRDRVIFPIFNLSGRIIGFGGRGIDDYTQPKYLNSPETPIFKKGEVLYGIFQAKESMRTKNEAIIVEGYFDLLSLYQQGIKNTVAPLGTALTESQVMLISRNAKKVKLIFDPDPSGIKASLRAIGLLINAQTDVHVALLPEGYDPDKFINEKGVVELTKIINSAPDFFEFYKSSVKVETVEDEIALIRDLIEIISKIQDPLRFDRYLKYSARVFDISTEVILKEMKKRDVPEPERRPKSPTSNEEKIIMLIFNNIQYLPKAKEIITPEDFSDERVRRVYELLFKDETFDMADLSKYMVEEGLREKILSSLISEDRVSEADFVKALTLFKNSLQRGKIKKELAEAIRKGDEESLKKLKDLLKQKI